MNHEHEVLLNPRGPKRYERKPPGSNHYSNWDAAKLYQNMSQYSTNPVGALQERYQSRGVAPEYRMVQAEGASHCPTFSFQVFIGDMVAMGEFLLSKTIHENVTFPPG